MGPAEAVEEDCATPNWFHKGCSQNPITQNSNLNLTAEHLHVIGEITIAAVWVGQYLLRSLETMILPHPETAQPDGIFNSVTGFVTGP